MVAPSNPSIHLAIFNPGLFLHSGMGGGGLARAYLSCQMVKALFQFIIVIHFHEALCGPFSVHRSVTTHYSFAAELKDSSYAVILGTFLFVWIFWPLQLSCKD